MLSLLLSINLSIQQIGNRALNANTIKEGKNNINAGGY